MPQASYADWLAPIVSVMGVMVVSDITLTLLGGCMHRRSVQSKANTVVAVGKDRTVEQETERVQPMIAHPA